MFSTKKAAKLDEAAIGQAVSFVNAVHGKEPTRVLIELRHINHNGAETILEGHLLDEYFVHINTELEEFLVSHDTAVIIFDDPNG